MLRHDIAGEMAGRKMRVSDRQQGRIDCQAAHRDVRAASGIGTASAAR